MTTASKSALSLKPRNQTQLTLGRKRYRGHRFDRREEGQFEVSGMINGFEEKEESGGCVGIYKRNVRYD